jgi:hypothetical protein
LKLKHHRLHNLLQQVRQPFLFQQELLQLMFLWSLAEVLEEQEIMCRVAVLTEVLEPAPAA